MEQMSCRDKVGDKRNNTAAESHPSIWLWYRDDKYEKGAARMWKHVQFELASKNGIACERTSGSTIYISTAFSEDFIEGDSMSNLWKKNYTSYTLKDSALSDDQKNTEKKKRKDVMNVYTSHSETYTDVPCKVFEGLTTVNLYTFDKRDGK